MSCLDVFASARYSTPLLPHHPGKPILEAASKVPLTAELPSVPKTPSHAPLLASIPRADASHYDGKKSTVKNTQTLHSNAKPYKTKQTVCIYSTKHAHRITHISLRPTHSNQALEVLSNEPFSPRRAAMFFLYRPRRPIQQSTVHHSTQMSMHAVAAQVRPRNRPPAVAEMPTSPP